MGKIKFYRNQKEVAWDIKKVVAVDSAEGRGRCTRRFVQTVRKNAKSLSNPGMTVRYTAEIVSQSVRAKAVKRRGFFLLADSQRESFKSFGGFSK